VSKAAPRSTALSIGSSNTLLLWEVARYEPPSDLVLRSVSGRSPPPSASGSSPSMAVLPRSRSSAKRGCAAFTGWWPLMGRVARRQVETQLRTLKGLLENEAPEGS
jgi:hypothetical protein